MSSQYVRTASVNHIGSTHADRLSRHRDPANHHCDTLQAGVKPPLWYTTPCVADFQSIIERIIQSVRLQSGTPHLIDASRGGEEKNEGLCGSRGIYRARAFLLRCFDRARRSTTETVSEWKSDERWRDDASKARPRGRKKCQTQSYPHTGADAATVTERRRSIDRRSEHTAKATATATALFDCSI